MKIEVTTDPARIDEFRRSFQERCPEDPLERFFKELPEKFVITEAEAELLRRHRDEAVPRLLEVAEGARKDLPGGVSAIVALCLLEEPRVLPIARKLSRARRSNSYRYILFDAEARFLGTDPEIRRQLLAGLDSDDPERVKEAVQECGILEVPGAMAKFAEMIRRPDAPGRGRMAFWISQQAPTREHLDLIGAVWLDGPQVRGDEGAEFLGTVARLAKDGPPEVRRAAVELLLRWFRDVRDGVRPLDFLSGSCVIHDALQALRCDGAGDRRCVALVDDLIRSGHRVVETFLGEALRVIAVGDPGLHRARCLEMLEGPDAKASRVAAASLGEAYAGSGDDELVAAIRAARVQHGGADQHAEALSRISGAEADAAAEADLDAQGPMTGMRVQWRTRGLTLEGSLARLMEVGALPEGPGAAALAEEARRSFREIWRDREQDPADLLLQALTQAGVLRGFDTEADVIPPPHDELILGLAPPGDAAFAVQAARQSWNLPPGVEEDDWPDDEQMEQSDYTVEFLQDGRLFSFRAEFFRDWYDAGSVVIALNYALREAGRPERFHPLDTDGQATTLLLLTPAAATIARKELFFPIGKAPEITVGRGRGRGGKRPDRG